MILTADTDIISLFCGVACSVSTVMFKETVLKGMFGSKASRKQW